MRNHRPDVELEQSRKFPIENQMTVYYPMYIVDAHSPVLKARVPRRFIVGLKYGAVLANT